MARPWAWLGVGLAFSTAQVCAQAPQVQGATITLHLDWIDQGRNGVLEPYDSAFFTLSVSISPAPGSPINWDPIIGGSGSGILRGLQSIFIDLIGSGGTEGQWSGIWVEPEWDFGPQWHGTPLPGGTGLQSIHAGQLPPSQSGVNTYAYIAGIWRGTWTPSSYEPRIVTFSTVSAAANPLPLGGSVIVKDANLPEHVLFGTSVVVHDSTWIMLVPSPSAAAVCGIPAIRLLRRRRRGAREGAL